MVTEYKVIYHHNPEDHSQVLILFGDYIMTFFIILLDFFLLCVLLTRSLVAAL
jgi:hypothetical protein